MKMEADAALMKPQANCQQPPESVCVCVGGSHPRATERKTTLSHLGFRPISETNFVCLTSRTLCCFKPPSVWWFL